MHALTQKSTPLSGLSVDHTGDLLGILMWIYCLNVNVTGTDLIINLVILIYYLDPKKWSY